MKKLLKKGTALILCAALVLSMLCIGALTGAARQSVAYSENNKYKIRLLVFEVDTFNCSNAAFGGDSAPYQNFGSEHIAYNEDWCRVDYRDLNGTGAEQSEYITLYDRDGDGRYNVVSAWGSSGGYFPSKNGIVINGFPTYLYSHYYKVSNSWKGKNGQYKIFLQVASLQNGEWVWSEGTNEDIGDATMSDSFNSEKQATYGGGVLELLSNRSGDNVNNVELIAQGAVPQSKYPQAQGGTPTAAYEQSSVICPRTNEEAIVNPITVQNAPKDQYGIAMSASVNLSASVSEEGFAQSGLETGISNEANLDGGTYNSEEYNAQTLTADITWPQLTGEAKTAQASFTAVDYQTPVFVMDQNGTKIDQTDYYYGCMPNLPAPARAYDDTKHYINVRWDHERQAVSDSSDNTYTLLYSTAEHLYGDYEQLDTVYHTAYCRVDLSDVHSIKLAHEFVPQTVAPTCTAGGCVRHICEKCGYYYDTDAVPASGHQWDAGVITKPASCDVNGIRTYTCTVCQQTKTENISALEHEPVLRYVEPTDQAAGGVYFECENCGKFWSAVYSETLGDYDIPDETPLDDLQQALSLSEPTPAPYFNIFTDELAGCDYSLRGASLKYLFTQKPDYQPMRFCASLRVPEHIAYQIGAPGDALVDVGIVYSQSALISSADALKIDAENVYQMSLREKNGDTVYDGSNWSGITMHTRADGVHLTFNLLLQVMQENWSKEYCARAYVTYRYHGITYTVYDHAYSSRSVAYIANCVAANDKEPAAAREYCETYILKLIEN
ncbi:MAG: hypothetical protein IKE65_10150 [Clostridia bacterium]|nr:hypothetical protein [Clostridia bacterium]